MCKGPGAGDTWLTAGVGGRPSGRRAPKAGSAGQGGGHPSCVGFTLGVAISKEGQDGRKYLQTRQLTGLNLQNIEAAHTTQQQRNKQRN